MTKDSTSIVEEQLRTLRERSAVAESLGAPRWLRDAESSPCLAGPLTKEQVDAFFQKGYVIVEDIFAKEEFTPVGR
jgi:hypothetical protein